MSSKIQNPNEKGCGFTYAVIALVVIAAILVGYIVIDGRKKHVEVIAKTAVDAHIAVSVVDDAIRLASEHPKPHPAEVDLFEDYSCPHCAELAEATDGDMLKAIEDGKLVVNIRSLNFLDHDGKGHSTLVGAAARAVAETGNGYAYWNLRRYSLENLNTVYNWKPKDYANVVRAFGGNDKAQDIVKKSSNFDDYRKNEEKSADRLQKAVGKISSPHVLRDGKEVPLENWVATVTAGQ